MDDLVEKYLEHKKLNEAWGTNSKEIEKDIKKYFTYRDTWMTQIKKAKSMKDVALKKDAEFLSKKMSEIETALFKVSMRIGRSEGISKALFKTEGEIPTTH